MVLTGFIFNSPHKYLSHRELRTREGEIETVLFKPKSSDKLRQMSGYHGDSEVSVVGVEAPGVDSLGIC